MWLRTVPSLRYAAAAISRLSRPSAMSGARGYLLIRRGTVSCAARTAPVGADQALLEVAVAVEQVPGPHRHVVPQPVQGVQTGEQTVGARREQRPRGAGCRGERRRRDVRRPEGERCGERSAGCRGDGAPDAAAVQLAHGVVAGERQEGRPAGGDQRRRAQKDRRRRPDAVGEGLGERAGAYGDERGRDADGPRRPLGQGDGPAPSAQGEPGEADGEDDELVDRAFHATHGIRPSRRPVRAGIVRQASYLRK